MTTTGAVAGQSVGEALDGARLTGTHWKLWFLSAMGVFLDAFDLFILSVALPLIERDFSADSWQLGLIGAAAPLGAVVGAAVVGHLTDRVGRKAIYFFDLMSFVVFAVLSALAWSLPALIAFRFLLGIGIGADYPISSTYISEFMPARVRGRMLVSAFSFQALGSLAGAAVGLLILLIYPEPEAWRWMLATGVIPALIVIALRSTSPESPRWQQAHGKSVEAAATVSRLVGRPVEATTPAGRPLPWRALFSRPFIRLTILATLPWFLMDVSLYGVGLFTPTILNVLGFTDMSPTQAVSWVTTDIRSTEGAVFLDVFLVIGFVLAIWLIDQWGRIRLQMMGLMGMTAGLVMVATAAGLPGSNEEHIELVLLGYAVFNVMVNWGPNPTTFTLPAELFPTSLRASGQGLAAGAGKVGAAVGIFFLPVLVSHWGLSRTMAAVAVTSTLGFVVTWVFGVETAGRSLEELESGDAPAMRQLPSEPLALSRSSQ